MFPSIALALGWLGLFISPRTSAHDVLNHAFVASLAMEDQETCAPRIRSLCMGFVVAPGIAFYSHRDCLPL